MKTTSKVLMVALAAVALLLPSILASPAEAGARVSFAYTSSPADIRVWLDRQGHHDDDYYYDDDDYGESYEYDVYPSADDVVLYFRASRSCYATVYVVDTDGYIHVVHPFSTGDRAFIRGGRVYEIRLGDLGYEYGFDRGVAYAFAVSSPVPFNYGHYGVGIFGPRFGFRIYGDPYVASKRFYLNLVAGGCDPYLIGVSHARFYVREYVRYPRYLCVGWHDYYGVHQYCRGNCSVYRHYNLHARAPHRVLHPKYKIKHKISDYTRIDRHHGKREHETRFKARKGLPREGFKTRSGKHLVKTKSRVDTRKGRAVHKNVVKSRGHKRSSRKVVRSSKSSFVKGKSQITEMRRQLKNRNSAKRPQLKDRNTAKRSKTIKDSRNSKRVQKAAKRNAKRVQKAAKRNAKTNARVAKKSSKVKKSSHARKGSAAKSRSGSGKRSKRGK